MRRTVNSQRSAASLVALAALAPAALATATTITWTGAAGDGLWHNANNWNPVQVPTASDDVAITRAAMVAQKLARENVLRPELIPDRRSSLPHFFDLVVCVTELVAARGDKLIARFVDGDVELRPFNRRYDPAAANFVLRRRSNHA